MTTRILTTLLLASTVSLAACAGSPTAPAPAPAPAPQAAPPATVQQPAAIVPLPDDAFQRGEAVHDAVTPLDEHPVDEMPLDMMGAWYQKADAIVFQSDRRGGAGKNDIFVFRPSEGTLHAIPGVNTARDELNPRISKNGKWLVFQRAEAGHQNIYLYNMETHLLNELPGLNTETGDEYMPDVSDDGGKIVYIRSGGGNYSLLWFDDCDCGGGFGGSSRAGATVHLYDVKSATDYTVPGATANVPFGEAHWPSISADGKTIAYSASASAGVGSARDSTYTRTGGSAYAPGTRIYVYDVKDFRQLTPPFVNEGGSSSYNPDLSPDGKTMLFVSNRNGNEQIFEVDFRTGELDNLQFANQPYADNQHPRYLCDTDRIVFQTKKPDRPFGLDVAIYDRQSGTLDTLPLINGSGANDGVRGPQTELF